MLTHEDNELLCRVEPGTPMHEAFKRYWLVAGRVKDLGGPDCDPQRVTILCEDYVMFRDSAGKVGFLRERCCHRGASLCLGRNEEGGIRCIYHGWKFAVDGTVLDTPNTTDEKFKTRYRQPSFPAVELGGLIWVYLGPKELQPPLPDYYWLHYDDSKRDIAPVMFNANYTQAVDGGADSSHLTILHQDALGRTTGRLDDVRERILKNSAPRFETYPTDFGQFSVAVRTVPGADGEMIESARVSAYIAPSTVQVTGGIKGRGGWGVATPVTSEKTIFYIGVFDKDGVGDWADQAQRFQNIDDESLHRIGIHPNSPDREEKFSRANNWGQDRAKMKAGKAFAGLHLFIPEDIAVAESAGAIYDRSEENLVPADQVIVRIRRILMDIARDVKAGRQPLGLRDAVDTSAIYTAEATLQPGDDWRQVALPPEFRPKVEASVEAA
jgi:phthalate 4,5-dioxygenase